MHACLGLTHILHVYGPQPDIQSEMTVIIIGRGIDIEAWIGE
jgi:hypothetical protein